MAHARKDPHYGTLYVDTGIMDTASLDGHKHFLAMGLRVKGTDGKPLLIPFFTPIKAKTAMYVIDAVGEVIRFTQNCR